MAENLTTNTSPAPHLRTFHVKDDHSLISHEPRAGLFAIHRGHATEHGTTNPPVVPKVSGPSIIDAPNLACAKAGLQGAATTAWCVTNPGGQSTSHCASDAQMPTRSPSVRAGRQLQRRRK